MRKTVSIKFAIEKANYFLKHSEPTQAMERKGTANMLECLLSETGAYAGFGYLVSAGLQKENGYIVEMEDETRRHYYVKSSL